MKRIISIIIIFCISFIDGVSMNYEHLNYIAKFTETNCKPDKKPIPVVNKHRYFYPENVDALTSWQVDKQSGKLTHVIDIKEDEIFIISWNVTAIILVNSYTIKTNQIPLTRENYGQFIRLYKGENTIEVVTNQPDIFTAYICDARGFPINFDRSRVPLLTEDEIIIPYHHTTPLINLQQQKNISLKEY